MADSSIIYSDERDKYYDATDLSPTQQATLDKMKNAVAKQVHSLTFVLDDDSSRNTWVDWHLVPTSRPAFTMPQLKKYSQDIPGANGELDYTQALTGYPAFQNRTGSIEFLVMNTNLDTSLGTTEGYNGNSNYAWRQLYSSIANFLHGKRVRIYSNDILDYWLKGRVTVNDWKSGDSYSSITLNYDVDPYMYSIQSSDNMWLWDPFSFETGVIRTYSSSNLVYTVDGLTDANKQTIVGTQTPVVPTIHVDCITKLKTGDGEFILQPGVPNDNPNIIIYPGKQTWNFFVADGVTSQGHASIYFRERSL